MKLNGSDTPIKINGSNIDLGEPLLREVQEKLSHVARTHFGHLNHGTVGFTRDGHSHRCTINIQVGNLKVIVAEASAADCHQAFDQALVKIGRRLLRRKQRMADRSRNQRPAQVLA